MSYTWSFSFRLQTSGLSYYSQTGKKGLYNFQVVSSHRPSYSDRTTPQALFLAGNRFGGNSEIPPSLALDKREISEVRSAVHLERSNLSQKAAMISFDDIMIPGILVSNQWEMLSALIQLLIAGPTCSSIQYIVISQALTIRLS